MYKHEQLLAGFLRVNSKDLSSSQKVLRDTDCFLAPGAFGLHPSALYWIFDRILLGLSNIYEVCISVAHRREKHLLDDMHINLRNVLWIYSGHKLIGAEILD